MSHDHLAELLTRRATAERDLEDSAERHYAEECQQTQESQLA